MELIELRKEIDKVNEAIVELIHRRFSLVRKCSETKEVLYDPNREEEIIRFVRKKGKELGLDEAATERIFRLIIEEGKKSIDKIVPL